MSMKSKMVRYWGLASAVLVLAPITAVAATTGAQASSDAPPRYTTVSTNDISLPNNDGTFGIATCPEGTVVLGGGAYIASSSVQTGINASFEYGQRAWEAVANNFSGAATTFNVYAVCAKRPHGYEYLVSPLVSNPAGDQTSATLNCPGDDYVLGGGVFDEDPAFSVGLASSYPNPGLDGWTAAVSNFSGTNSEFEVVAVCASPSVGWMSRAYEEESPVTSDPAGTQVGLIEDCNKGQTVALTGGIQSSNTTNLRIEMKTTQPFPASGAGWKAGENNDTGYGTTLTAYVLCGN